MTLNKENWNHLTEKEKHVILNGEQSILLPENMKITIQRASMCVVNANIHCMKVQVNSIQDVVGRVLTMKSRDM